MVERELPVNYRTIVVATDGSSAARQAVRHAANLAGKCGASLRVINVVNTNIAFHLGAYQKMALETLQEEGQQAVAEALEMARQAGVQDVTGEVISGSPRQSILDWAEMQGADLLVVGSHGYSRVTYLLIGSVAEYVVRHASCPVLVVRGRKE